MELAISLPYSKQPAFRHISESDQSKPRPSSHFLNISLSSHLRFGLQNATFPSG